MKRLGLGFAALIAVLTMSFTIVSKEVRPTVANGCYTSVTIGNPPNSKVYTSTQSPTNPSTLVPKPQTSTLNLPSPNSPVTAASGSVTDYATTGCISPFNNFCCFEVISNAVNTIYYKQ